MADILVVIWRSVLTVGIVPFSWTTAPAIAFFRFVTRPYSTLSARHSAMRIR